MPSIFLPRILVITNMTNSFCLMTEPVSACLKVDSPCIFGNVGSMLSSSSYYRWQHADNMTFRCCEPYRQHRLRTNLEKQFIDSSYPSCSANMLHIDKRWNTTSCVCIGQSHRYINYCLSADGKKKTKRQLHTFSCLSL